MSPMKAHITMQLLRWMSIIGVQLYNIYRSGIEFNIHSIHRINPNRSIIVQRPRRAFLSRIHHIEIIMGPMSAYARRRRQEAELKRMLPILFAVFAFITLILIIYSTMDIDEPVIEIPAENRDEKITSLFNGDHLITMQSTNGMDVVSPRTKKSCADGGWMNDEDLWSFIPESVLNNPFLETVCDDPIFRELFSQITRHSFLRSQPLPGNAHSFWRLFEMMDGAEDECIRMAVIGGSNTAGMGLNRTSAFKEKRFWEYFKIFLNGLFPRNGCKHTAERMGNWGSNMNDGLIANFMSETSESYNLVLVEMACNENAEITKNIQSNEQLLRFLLRLDPQPVIMYLDFCWRYGYAPPITKDHPPKMPFWEWFGSFGHSEILFVYQIPYFSMFHVMYPMHLYKDIVANGEIHKTPHDRFYKDCCHPKYMVHQLAALMMGYAFQNEYRYWLKMQRLQIEDQEFDSFLMPPLYKLSPEEDRQIEHDLKRKVVFDLNFIESDGQYDKKWDEVMVRNRGWQFMDDTVKNKFGFIAGVNGTVDGSEIVFALDRAKEIDLIDIGFMKSYENFGNAVVWIDEAIHDDHRYAAECGSDRVENERGQKLVSLHSEKVSRPRSLRMENEWKSKSSLSGPQYLHFCPVPSDNEQKWTKFKITRITAYAH